MRVDFTDIKDYFFHATSYVSCERLKAYKFMQGNNVFVREWVEQWGVKVLPNSTIEVIRKANRLPSSTCNHVYGACECFVDTVNTVMRSYGRK